VSSEVGGEQRVSNTRRSVSSARAATVSAAPAGLDKRALLAALAAFKRGDFSVRLPLELTGLDGKIADTFNELVDLNARLESELRRLAQAVGQEGRIAQRGTLGNVRGGWTASIESVNSLIDDLVHPTHETARVIGAVARGDLSQSMALEADGRPLRGEFLRTAKTVNTMVDQLGSFASEVTRVTREVGSEGKLGGQARVKGAAGTWKDLTDSVNLMAGNLTAQVRNIAEVATAVATGDLSRKITVDVKGEILELKNTLNTMVDQLNSFAAEVTRVAREVGTEGKLGGQADVKGVAGVWKDLTDNVNSMASNLTDQVRGIANVVTAVATGDLSRKITVDVKGEILELKNTINVMVDQLNSFAAEVTRVAREVGSEGKLGGQADVKGVAGVWKDLTDNVNSMASNLTDQVRGIVKVVTAVANGDLERQLTVEAKGEIAALAETINGMIETLATFADQVTTVAREVGVEGQLGGQASVPGAAGTWKDLTDNVNQLAANLTTQMRAIAEVATAVTSGDLTRSIAVEARGEVAALKDYINEMIRHLRDTTQKNTDQDWLKTNLAKFSRMLQGQKDLLTVGRLILSELAPVVYAQHGVFYILDASGPEPELRLFASYAHREREGVASRFKLGEGLVGQCALEKSKIAIDGVPAEYIRISSGLGEAAPVNVIVLPVVFEGQLKAVIELGSFQPFNPTQHAFLDQLAETIGIVLNTIEANTRTEDLLKQSQSLAIELQNQQEELRQTNQQLEEKAGLLAQQNAEVELKNREIEQARQALEEKARQLTITSKYKSEFLANMSHELRTPLNSLLILSDQLSRNPEGNLSARQTEFAKTIHSSGTDLLTLINDILDLSKIESGTTVVDVGELRFSDLLAFVDRTFRHVADSKGLQFSLELGSDVPRAMSSDSKRVQQVIKNLLSNAFKFTERGSVELSVGLARSGWNPEHEVLGRGEPVIAFRVRDTGIGIPPAKQQIIFESFQQADGSTSRRYGGTGLGLTISREIAQLLGGDLTVSSLPGEGSTFTLYLPRSYVTPPRPARRTGVDEAQLRSELELAALERVAAAREESPAPQAIPDDRSALEPEDRCLLIVDNDEDFARYLLDVAREHGFKGLIAGSGASAVALARQFEPRAITLDIRLPDVDGLRVLRLLKADFQTRHIPVEIISTDDRAESAYALGARGVLAKPIPTREQLDAMLTHLRDYVDQPVREILVTGAGEEQAAFLAGLLGGPDANVTRASCQPHARELLAQARFACVVIAAEEEGLDLDLAQELQNGLGSGAAVVLSAPEGSEPRERLAQVPIGLGRRLSRAGTPAVLLDVVSLLLHRPFAALPDAKRKLLEELGARDGSLRGRKALIVDDDVRNIFALASVLEKQDMHVLSAEDGKTAIELLQETPDVDVVLMDIMMPQMDGNETISLIRRMPRLQSLPIIAVTAKAMKGDREKTLEAGAWDYLTKPVEPERMLTVLRGWLRR
jgi:signal transduction histidine kinase/CheY-like chemotaxis protein/HAMP domain-containing protein